MLSAVIYYLIYRYFFYYGTINKQYVFLVLIPILMLFVLGEYINTVVFGMSIVEEAGLVAIVNPLQMLTMQLLGMASLFCILFAYKKLLQSFRLSTELSLLEQQEHSLNRYVEEAKAHYERTRSFRHDIRNHITVMKNLLENGKTEAALHYIEDLDEMAQRLSFPCSTNNPVVDILAGNKLGIAKSMGIRVSCSLCLPYPCGIRDIDICIILSNALDNAIHACRNMEEGADRYIHVAGRIQGDFLFLEVENSFQGEGTIAKGTGLSNIKNVTEKYRGAMSVQARDTVFALNMLLIIPQQTESI